VRPPAGGGAEVRNRDREADDYDSGHHRWSGAGNGGASGTTVLSGDLATAIADLKAEPGGELQVHGSGILTRWLLENDLVESTRRA
jgi:hypothetical protein